MTTPYADPAQDLTGLSAARVEARKDLFRLFGLAIGIRPTLGGAEVCGAEVYRFPLLLDGADTGLRIETGGPRSGAVLTRTPEGSIGPVDCEDALSILAA